MIIVSFSCVLEGVAGVGVRDVVGIGVGVVGIIGVVGVAGDGACVVGVVRLLLCCFSCDVRENELMSG